MDATLDGERLFGAGEVEIAVGSIRRDAVTRAMPGLDGVLSIDMGRRGREIRQRGCLRAPSRSALKVKKDAIAAYMDGETHTLVTGGGEQFSDLRIDAFEVRDQQIGGGGLYCDYEIVYSQMMV